MNAVTLTDQYTISSYVYILQYVEKKHIVESKG